MLEFFSRANRIANNKDHARAGAESDGVCCASELLRRIFAELFGMRAINCKARPDRMSRTSVQKSNGPGVAATLERCSRTQPPAPGHFAQGKENRANPVGEKAKPFEAPPALAPASHPGVALERPHPHGAQAGADDIVQAELDHRHGQVVVPNQLDHPPQA
jgi:hypothetical protein